MLERERRRRNQRKARSGYTGKRSRYFFLHHFQYVIFLYEFIRCSVVFLEYEENKMSLYNHNKTTISIIVSLPILGLLTLLQIFVHLPSFTLLLLLLFCPGVQAAATESPFPDISFDVFHTFVQSTFSSKISLITVLMLLFTITENTDLLNLHTRQQNPQFSYEHKRESSPWMNSLARAIQRQISERKLKTLFKKKELPEDL